MSFQARPPINTRTPDGRRLLLLLKLIGPAARGFIRGQLLDHAEALELRDLLNVLNDFERAMDQVGKVAHG